MKRAWIQRLLVVLTLLWGVAGAARAQEWVPLADTDLRVQPGSALDFSSLMDDAPRDFTRQRASIGSEPQLCATLVLSPSVGGFPVHAEADQLADEAWRRGYRLARIHFADATLMTGRFKDFDYDPEQLDRLHYLMAALKKRGVAWMVDMMSSWNGSLGNVRPHRWVHAYELGLDVHWKDAARKHYAEQVRALWARKNPYTGQSTLADPALAGVILANENNIRFLINQKPVPDGLVQSFGEWLNAPQRPAEMRNRWAKVLDMRVALERYLHRSSNDPLSEDVDAFLVETEVNTYQFMAQTVKDAGYAGQVTLYHTWDDRQARATRARLSWLDIHAYHDHPSNYDHPGSTVTNASSLGLGPNYLDRMVAARQPGKPFSASEYGHPFWSAYRHEAGVMVPAVAALQQWGALCRMAENSLNLRYGSTFERERHLTPFMVGLDPVARAGETLAALLYQRGDAREIADSKLFVERALGRQAAPNAQLPLSLLTPRTHAAVVRAGGAFITPEVRFEQLTTPAAVSASVVDKAANLAASERWLLIVNTDAENTDMRFTAPDRKQLQYIGHLPVRVRSVKLRLSIQRSTGRGVILYPLDLNGRRRTALAPAAGEGGYQVFDIDTATGSARGALYFEVLRSSIKTVGTSGEPRPQTTLGTP